MLLFMSNGFSGTKYNVLQAVVRHWDTSNFGPTIQEIADKAGLKYRSAVHYHVKDLIASGMLTQIPRRRRTIKPTDMGKKMVELMDEVDQELGLDAAPNS